jgi:hypothetical protein
VLDEFSIGYVKINLFISGLDKIGQVIPGKPT